MTDSLFILFKRPGDGVYDRRSQLAGERRENMPLTGASPAAMVTQNNLYNTVTYKAYIRQDYKAEVVWEPELDHRSRLRRRILATALCGVVTLVGYAHYSYLSQHNGEGWSLSSDARAHAAPEMLPPLRPEFSHTVVYPSAARQTTSELSTTVPAVPAVHTKPLPETEQIAMLPAAAAGPHREQQRSTLADDAADEIASKLAEPETAHNKENWESVVVKRGDSMALIFSRLGLSAADLHTIMQLGDATVSLRRIMPGQELRFLIEDGQLQALHYDPDNRHTLEITRDGNGFTTDMVEAELTIRTRAAVATINSSLFLAGQRAGLSDNLIMQLVALYGWDVDFALDIRSGDQFMVIFQESYRDDVKVRDGPILAAEFVNRGRELRAVRYVHEDGSIDYYSDSGDSMRKAFIRTPLDVYRISSHFGPRRHPVLHNMRMHRGVDYAAPTGTPIRAAGDGRVTHLGRKGGYGNTIILRHGGRYTTLYAHMSRFANGLRNGNTVKQGQVIGYVGATGMATGPHLHYEFRVDGVHKDPLKVELPQAESIPKEQLATFKSRTRPLLAELDALAIHSGHLEVADIKLDEAILLALSGGSARE